MWFLSAGKSRRTPVVRSPRRGCRPCLEALEDRCLLSAGALDPTFGNGAGYVTPPANFIGRYPLTQPDGKIVVTGDYKNPSTGVANYAAVRYNADGSIDTSFGSGGMTQAFIATPSKKGFANTLDYGGGALYPKAGTANDGKIVMAGRAYVIGKSNFSLQFSFGLARFNTNGTLDATFGNGGMVTTTFSVGARGATSLVIQPDGKIVAVGTGDNDALELARYNTNGSLDTSFGSSGVVVTSFAQFSTFTARSLLLEPDGTLIVAGDTGGSAPNDWLLVHYKANGVRDTSFGNQGVVATPVSSGFLIGGGEYSARSAALYPSVGSPNDGKILVNGSGGNGSWELVRYNGNGTLDGTFGNGGEEFAPIGGGAGNVALDSSGRPVVAGNGNAYSLQLARFNLNGTLDATFGNDGVVTNPVGFTVNNDGVAIYPNTGSANDGKIVYVVGSLVARYLPSEPEIGSFTANPNPVASGSNPTLTAANITDGNAGSTITQMAFYVQLNGTNTLLGYGTQTSPGVWTYTFTVNLASGSYTLFAVAEDSYAVFGDPVAMALTVQ
jgi:uncharacterized delta-60 repeat protein